MPSTVPVSRERREPSRARHAEVRHVNDASLVKQEVRGLDVAVHDAALVRAVERVRRLFEPWEHALGRLRTLVLEHALE